MQGAGGQMGLENGGNHRRPEAGSPRGIPWTYLRSQSPGSGSLQTFIYSLRGNLVVLVQVRCAPRPHLLSHDVQSLWQTWPLWIGNTMQMPQKLVPQLSAFFPLSLPTSLLSPSPLFSIIHSLDARGRWKCSQTENQFQKKVMAPLKFYFSLTSIFPSNKYLCLME